MATSRKPLCAEVSAGMGEALGATASRIDNWILLEYRGVWGPEPLQGSMLDPSVKAHLAAQLSRPRSRLLFIRRPRQERHGVACYTARTSQADQSIHRLDLDVHEELVGLDLFGADRGKPVDEPLFVVCTHGKRDRCCARYGRPLYDALRDQTDPEWVWQCTHVGGDRFAGNLVCFPEGLFLRAGRARRRRAAPRPLPWRTRLPRLLSRPGRVLDAGSGGRAGRAGAHRADGFDDVRLVGVDGRRVALEAAGERHELEVTRVEGKPMYLTCDSEEMKRPVRFVVA